MKTSAGEELQHPPPVAMALRVGVVGHRPDAEKRPLPDEAAIRDITRTLLRKIQNSFAGVLLAHPDLFLRQTAREDGKPQNLRLISGLAEGPDQWVAAEAHDLGYELQAVLPFARAEYENDFKDKHALSEHQRLRDIATAVFELDGCRSLSGESYLAAGRLLLNQIDILIAVWDGKESYGTGGTAQIVQEALQRNVPTLWVSWQAPNKCQLLSPSWRLLQTPTDVKNDMKPIEVKVRELLLPPSHTQRATKAGESDPRADYFAETGRTWTVLGGWWNFFRDILRGKPTGLTVRLPAFVPTTRSDWREDWMGNAQKPRLHPFSSQVIEWVEANYLSHYAWANQLSIHYGNNYRSSFVWIYLLGALAVLLALFGKTAQVSFNVEMALIVVEILVICLIIGLTSYGRRKRWHERWIDYRTAAERLRLARFNCLLGGVWQQATVPSHLVTFGNPATAWMQWHARAVERAAGLISVRVDKCYLSSCREFLLDALIEGQGKYHKENVERLQSVDHRLERSGEGLFLATLVICITHLIVVALGEPWFGESAAAADRWLIFAAAFLPALGASMAALRSHGEFHRVVQRSRAMQEELAQLREAVADVPVESNELNLQRLQRVAEQISQLMYNEVLDWRIVFQDRPLVWPA